MLIDLKALMSDRGCVSLSEIARSLAVEPAAVEPMLEHWMRKGKIRKRGEGVRCAGCYGCAPADLEFYEWTDRSLPQQEPRSSGCCRDG